MVMKRQHLNVGVALAIRHITSVGKYNGEVESQTWVLFTQILLNA